MDREQPYSGPELSRQAPVAEAGFNKGGGQFLSSGKNQEKKKKEKRNKGGGRRDLLSFRPLRINISMRSILLPSILRA